MAHWAELDSNNVVLRVTVGDNNEPDEGYQWLIDNLGGRWVKTSYNNNIRVRYAGIGMSYDEELDAFIYPQCHEEATLDEVTCDWVCDNADHTVEV
jgi:hypothetical protein